MQNIQLILTIAIPIYSLITILLGVWIGHKLTMKAFSHVQPSPKEMSKMYQGSASTEEDYFDEAMKEPAPEMTPKKESYMKRAFSKLGIPNTIWDSYKKSGKDPANFLGYGDNVYMDEDVKTEKGGDNGA